MTPVGAYPRTLPTVTDWHRPLVQAALADRDRTDPPGVVRWAITAAADRDALADAWARARTLEGFVPPPLARPDPAGDTPVVCDPTSTPHLVGVTDPGPCPHRGGGTGPGWWVASAARRAARDHGTRIWRVGCCPDCGTVVGTGAEMLLETLVGLEQVPWLLGCIDRGALRGVLGALEWVSGWSVRQRWRWRGAAGLLVALARLDGPGSLDLRVAARVAAREVWAASGGWAAPVSATLERILVAAGMPVPDPVGAAGEWWTPDEQQGYLDGLLGRDPALWDPAGCPPPVR